MYLLCRDTNRNIKSCCTVDIEVSSIDSCFFLTKCLRSKRYTSLSKYRQYNNFLYFDLYKYICLISTRTSFLKQILVIYTEREQVYVKTEQVYVKTVGKYPTLDLKRSVLTLKEDYMDEWDCHMRWENK